MIASFRFTGQSAAMTATDLDQLVAQTCRNLDKDPPGRTGSFGKKLCEAVAQRVHNRCSPVIRPAGFIVSASASASDDNESFAEKVTRAVKEQTARRPDSRKATEDRAEQERSRYGRGGLQRRVRNKGE
jgi:hypothetical protein